MITENLGSFDRYLTNCIEDAVLKVKQAGSGLTVPEGAILTGAELEAVLGAAAEP